MQGLEEPGTQEVQERKECLRPPQEAIPGLEFDPHMGIQSRQKQVWDTFSQADEILPSKVPGSKS